MLGDPQDATGADMDLDRRLDPEIAAALAELPIMDLSDIPARRVTTLERRGAAAAGARANLPIMDRSVVPAARRTRLDRRPAAAADAQPSPTVVRQDHLVPGLNG